MLALAPLSHKLEEVRPWEFFTATDCPAALRTFEMLRFGEPPGDRCIVE